LPDEDLSPVTERSWESREVAWRSSAARAFHLAALGDSLVLGRADVEVLPHQVSVLDRALTADPVRLLLADEVGLGKTIEAGLVFSELKARGRVRRVLVVAPKGVQLQWVAEMRNRFGEAFALIGSTGITVDIGVDPWRSFDRIVCSMDSVKPVRQRAGWSDERLEEHNRRRFRALVEAGWDLVIIDEAHHVAGSSDDVARHELARELAAIVPNVLLLSATPHSGKTDAFVRLLGLLDPQVGGAAQVTRDMVSPLVVRTEKRSAVDASGAALFQPRTTVLETVPYGERRVEQTLYESVTEYVRSGYARAKRERRPAIGFLVLLMQRLVSSSTAAILAALERRAEALATDGEQTRLFAERAEQWGELSGEEQVEALAAARGEAWGDELREVEILLDLARKASATGMDAKAAFLLDLLRRIQRDEGDPAIKIVVFTEFVQTQHMLLRLLESAGIPAVAINGGMGLEERAVAQDRFRDEVRVLVSTDAGGEGINLQFAHVVVNYDLPWNPMRIEQRIGRVDRIGQREPVRAVNLVLENSVDQYVLGVLEEKLWRILAELGADKWGDVLESTSRSVESVYADAIVEPERLEQEVAELAKRTKREIADSETLRAMMAGPDVEVAARRGDEVKRLVDVASSTFERWSGQSLPEPLAVLERMREVAPSESVPIITGDRAGHWSLWEVRPDGGQSKRDCFALFVTDEGAVRPDLADRVWLSLTEGPDIRVGPPLDAEGWDTLQQTGKDHAYGPCRDLAPESAWSVPWLTLRLLVRVESA
jgi:superfamily II DNA or RNA helicase